MSLSWKPVAKILVATLVGLGLFINAGVASARNVRLDVPEEDPGPPTYIFAINDEDWVAIFFIRDRACTPDTANLLGFPGPAVFSCPLAIEGHAIFDSEGGPVPRMAHFRQSGPIEVWFVSTDEFRAAIADGVLTEAELAALPSLLTGTAQHYTSTHHFRDGEQKVAGSVTGILEDGRTFSVQASGNERSAAGFPQQLFCACPSTGPVKITFR